MNNAIFGYSGFVGSYLTRFYKFNYLYNSKNIMNAENKNFDTIFISCIPAKKWFANKFPQEDTNTILSIKNILETIKANKVILISTIDVYNNINNKSNENTCINYLTNHTYGKNRYLFEEFIKSHFTDVHIIRLPALFGNGLKKNIIYDLINNNNVDKIYINSKFQWYNLEWIKEDIDVCLKNKLKTCNLFTEPMETSNILQLFQNKYTFENNPTKLFNYDCCTINYKYFKFGHNGYIRNKDIVYKSIEQFVKQQQIAKLSKFKLCVSNISNYSLKNEQYYNILKNYGIKYIEVAPTKFDEWNQLIIKNKLIEEKEIMKHCGLTLYSFQSITYTIQNNIFDFSNDILLKHLKNVIELAIKCDVKNLVFGCPRNRKLLDLNKDNDEIFIKFMSELGNYIGTRKLIISIENNSKKYNCNYLNTIEQVGEIVKKINNPNIKMMVDIGNCIMENDNITNIIKYKDLINHIHISMPFMKPLIKYNQIEYTNFINLLKNINYDKIISLEFLNNNEKDEVKLLDNTLNNFVNLILNK